MATTLNIPPRFATVDEVVEDIRLRGYDRELPNGKPFVPPRRDALSSHGRPGRVEANEALIADYILIQLGYEKRTDPPASELGEIMGAATVLREEFNASEFDPNFLKARRKYRPAFLAPDREPENRFAALAAIHRTKYARALRRELTTCVMGKKMNRSFSTSLFEMLMFGWGSPEIKGARDDLKSSSNTLDYVFGRVRKGKFGKGNVSIYQAFSAMLNRVDPRAAMIQNLEAIKELHADDPKIGVNLMIDGTSIEGPFSQVPAKSGSVSDWVLGRGERVGMIVRKNRKLVRGWYLIVIADMHSGLPIIWQAYPGTKLDEEGKDPTWLVEELHRLWPECPAETMVGDSEFSKGSEFARALEERFGIHPAFPLRGNYGTRRPYRDTQGHPCCAQHGLMKRDQAFHFLPKRKRLKNGIAPGSANPKDAHIAWKCGRVLYDDDGNALLDAQGNPRKCEVKTTTYIKHDPVLYQFMLRTGDTKYYWENKALERFRNGVECLFSSMKRRGNGQAGIGKAMWNETFQEAYWMMSATLLGITLGRLVHHTGQYERVHADMLDRDLI